MVFTDSQVEYAMQQYRREYGHGGMPHAWPGVSPSQAIADYHGKAPSITGFRPQVMLGTIADDVHACMNKMLNLHFACYFALRCEYLGRDDRPIEAKLYQMAGWGLRLDRETYEDAVRAGLNLMGVMLGDMATTANRRRIESAGNPVLTTA